jgi:hypothetical protein
MELEESNQLLAEIAQHFHQNNIHNFIDFRGLSPCQIFFSFEATHGLFFSLIAAGVLATCLNPDRPLPVEAWRNDGHLYHVVGPEVDRLFALLKGSLKQADGSLLEEAALALCRIREEVLPPNDLFVCHSRLLNTLARPEMRVQREVDHEPSLMFHMVSQLRVAPQPFCPHPFRGAAAAKCKLPAARETPC